MDRFLPGRPDVPLDAQAGDATAFEQLVAREDVSTTHAALTSCLSPLEIDVLTRYVGGASYEIIAEELDRQVKAVDNARQRIKRKLTQHLAEQMHLHAVA